MVVQIYNDVSPDGPQVSEDTGVVCGQRQGPGWKEAVQVPPAGDTAELILGRNCGQTVLVFFKKFTVTCITLFLL